MVSCSGKESEYSGSDVDADQLLQECLLSKEFLNFYSHYFQMSLKICEI